MVPGIRLLANPGMGEVLRSLGPRLERALSCEIEMTFGLFRHLKALIDANEFEVLVSTGEVASYAINEARVATPLIDLAKVGIGVAIKSGAPRPDIGSLAAFKQTLLSAKSISYTSGSTAGEYLDKLMERLGIAEQMKSKTKLMGGGGQNPRAVATGAVELGLSLISDIVSFPEAELLGPLPPELQYYIIERAGVSAVMANSEIARSLIDFLRSPIGRDAFLAQGMEPVE